MYTSKNPQPYVTSIPCKAMQNQNFRTALWTGHYLQMTLMSLTPGEDIGLEIHPDTDQYIRIEQGIAHVELGTCQSNIPFHASLSTGDAIFVPAGFWHNLTNTGDCMLKLSSIYAPPHHPFDTMQREKES